MNKYKLSSLAVSLLISITCQAKDVKAMFVSTPDTIISVLNDQQKENLISESSKDADTCSIVRNMFDKDSWISHIDDNLIVFHPSDVRIMEYRMLKSDTGDSILCLIDTYMAPEKESEVLLYDKDWNLIDKLDIHALSATVTFDPVVDKTIGAYVPVLEIPLLSAKFDEKDEKSLIITQAMPLFNNEEKNGQNASRMQTNVKWNGKTFK